MQTTVTDVTHTTTVKTSQSAALSNCAQWLNQIDCHVTDCALENDSVHETETYKAQTAIICINDPRILPHIQMTVTNE